jgi:regulator of protease activity HflC (stomatin/prohibitin superfamily)
MIFTVILAVMFLAFLAWGIYAAYRQSEVSPDRMPAGAPRWPWTGAFVALLLLVGSFGLVEIHPGRVGVVINLGVVQDEELPPGIHYVVPILNSVTEFDTRVRAVRIEGYTAASREQQDLFLNMTLNYHVIPTEASVIVSTIGTDFEAKIVMPRLLDIPKSVTDDYPTTTVLNSRDEIRAKAVSLLSAALEPYGLVVDTINLENFSYSEQYNAAIEERAKAEQAVQTERQNLEQARVRAEQAQVEAEGRANALIEQARGEAEANRLLAESISPILIQWQAIQKLQDNVEIMLVPSDGGFILDVGNLRDATP